MFFFAKAGAMNCVYEVTHFREAIREDPLFQNIDIVGVSEDAVPKLGMLSNGHELTYPLLSDPQRVAHRAYRVQRGLFRWWVSRVTYVIDERGIVRAGLDDWAWDKHVPFVAQELQKLDREQQQAAAASASNGTGPASSPQISSSPGGGSAPPQEGSLASSSGVTIPGGTPLNGFGQPCAAANNLPAGAVLPINGHAVVV